MHAIRRPIASILIGLATAIVIVTAVVLPFLTPQWVAFEQGRANATAWTGYTTEELRTATDAILSDLVFGPPDFDVEVAGRAGPRRARARPHARCPDGVHRALDPRGGVASSSSSPRAGGAIARRSVARRSTWRARAGGGRGVLGVVALVAFDALFELFHRILFPGGSYTFDPATERLVQLFPFAFWQETAMVVGVVIIAVALVTAVLAGRRAAGGRRPASATELATAAGIEPVVSRSAQADDRARGSGSAQRRGRARGDPRELVPVETERMSTAAALGRVVAEAVERPRLPATVAELGDGRLRDPGRRYRRGRRRRRRSSSASSATSRRVPRPASSSGPGRPSGSRPARASPTAPTPSCRSN